MKRTRIAWAPRLAAVALVWGAVQAAWAEPQLLVSAVPNPAVVGNTVQVEVSVTDVADLYAFQFSLGFDPSVLRLTSVAEGGFLAAGGSTFFLPGTVDAAAGTVSFVLGSLLDAVPGVGGSGVLALLGFDVLRDGASPLTLTDVLLVDSGLADISATASGAVLATVPEPASMALTVLCLAAAGTARGRVARRGDRG